MAIVVSNNVDLQDALTNAPFGETIVIAADFVGDPSGEVRAEALTIQSDLLDRPTTLTVGTGFGGQPFTFAVIGLGEVRVVGSGVFLFGGTGNDNLVAGDGDDRLDLATIFALSGETFEQLRGVEGDDRLVGGSGNDRYGVDSQFDEVIESPGRGHDTVFTTLLDYTLGANIEDLVFRNPNINSSDPVPPGNVVGAGNALDNTIVGGTGADYLSGLAGNDTLVGNITPSSLGDTLEGGEGDDQYEIDLLSDLIIENAGQGIDTARVTIGQEGGGFGGAQLLFSYDLSNPDNPGLANVENLILAGPFSGSDYDTFTLSGNALNNLIVGAEKGETLSGRAGNDRLIGGTGNDTMFGGVGDDYYEVDSEGDVVSEFDDAATNKPGQVGGRDTIATSRNNFDLSAPEFANVENLTATRVFDPSTGKFLPEPDVGRRFTGNALDNDLVGGDLNDTVIGATGNDFLIGGFGGDELIGGVGDDNYDVDSAGDRVIEQAGEGHDTIGTSLAAFTLEGMHVEDLLFSGALIVKALGNPETGEPRIVEFDRKAAFSGFGNELANAIVGADGNDILNGLAGNDALVGLIGDDILIGGDGRDELYGVSGRDKLFGGAGNDLLDCGSGHDRVSGHTGRDRLFGGSGNDRLGGGDDSDILGGGTGNDVLSGGNGNDRLFGEKGNDRLGGGDGSDRLYGDDGRDRLSSGNGNDLLAGGASSDTLRGGEGRDTFAFDAPLGARNVDRILDFNVVADRIQLEDTIFRTVGPRGQLLEAAFRAGTDAQDASDRLIYDRGSGALFYDPDGTGLIGKVQIASMARGLALSHADIVVV